MSSKKDLFQNLDEWLKNQPRRPGAPLGQYKKYGISLHHETAERVKLLAEALGYDFKDAVNESLQLWLERRHKDLKR